MPGRKPRIAKMSRNRIGGCRGHSGSHIERIFQPQIHDAPKRCVHHLRPLNRPIVHSYHRAAGACHSILGGWRLLRAILCRIAELLLDRTVVAGCACHCILPAAGIDNHGGDGKTLHRGGARPEYAKIGHAELARGKRAADDLIHQIPADEEFQLLLIQIRIHQGELGGFFKQGALCLLPCLLAHLQRVIDEVEA